MPEHAFFLRRKRIAAIALTIIITMSMNPSIVSAGQNSIAKADRGKLSTGGKHARTMKEGNARAAKTSAAKTSAVTREYISDGATVRMDLSGQILSLDANAVIFAKCSNLNPTLKFNKDESNFVPAAALAMKAKQFDDGLYAAVDLALQKGSSKRLGRRRFLRILAERIAAEKIKPHEKSNVQLVLAAAAHLSGEEPELPPELRSSSNAYLQPFLASEIQSKPIGFYSWSSELQRIFRQNRMMQSRLSGYDGVQCLIELLGSDQALKESYVNHLAFVSRLSNPYKSSDLRPFLRGESLNTYKVRHSLEADNLIHASEMICFLPSSCSPEDNLLQKLFRDKAIPDNFNLIDELITRIRSAKLSLSPQKDSGWYDHQLWALEAFLKPGSTPESKHLEFSPDYKDQLCELFKGLLALTRETHAVQFGAGGGAGNSPNSIYVYPDLSVEPTLTYYYRRALSYRFIKGVLVDYFGQEELSGLHRVKRNAMSALNLYAELSMMEQLFLGAYRKGCLEIGFSENEVLKFENKPIARESERVFENFARAMPEDPDLAVDGRMMIPLFYDPQKRKTKVLAFFGWAANYMHVTYKKEPRVLSIKSKDPHNSPSVCFEGAYYTVYFPLSREVYVDKILNREEFRALCDRNSNKLNKILRELSPKAESGAAPEASTPEGDD